MSGKVIDTMDDLDALLDGTLEESEEEETDVDVDEESDENLEDVDTEEVDEETQVEEEEEDIEDSEKSDEDEEPEVEEKEEDKKDIKTRPKDQHAFAQMRKEKKQLQETLDNIARGLGIDPKNEDALEKLSDLAYKGIAKREGKTKEEVIADSQAQRELQAYRKKDITENTTRAFASIRDELGADKNRLNEFANKLVQQGYDLLGQKEDWVGMYKNMYFDELVQGRVDAEVEKALKRDKAADSNSGKSKKKRGKRDSGGKQKIETMAELDKFLDTI